MDNQPSYMISGLRMPCVDVGQVRNEGTPGEKWLKLQNMRRGDYLHTVTTLPTSCRTDASDGRLELAVAVFDAGSTHQVLLSGGRDQTLF